MEQLRSREATANNMDTIASIIAALAGLIAASSSLLKAWTAHKKAQPAKLNDERPSIFKEWRFWAVSFDGLFCLVSFAGLLFLIFAPVSLPLPKLVPVCALLAALHIISALRNWD